jgi:hypothetical protein
MNRMNNFLPKSMHPKTIIAAATAAVLMSYAGFQIYKGYRTHKNVMLQQEKQKRLMEEQDAAYENQYFKEYDQLKDDPEAPVPSATSHVRDTTPQGDVIMTYDGERGMFCYYSDKRTVQFKYLESVARKYVIEHGCKRLHIDIRKEIAKAKTAAATETMKAAPTKAAAPAQVFAQLKKYSTNHGNNGNGSKLPTINELVKSKATNNSNNPTANASVLKEQVTRYVYCGRLDEFRKEEPVHETHDFSIIKPIDYASYKKMNDA